jgi:hypothetical protein
MARTTFSGPVASQNGFITVSNNDKIISLNAPGSLAASYSLTLPPNDGTSGQFLSTDGSGVLSWTAGDGTGTVTSVGGTGTVNGLTLTGTVTTSGSLTLGGSFALPTASAANVGAIANAINTTGKYTGKMVVDYATGIIYTATGATAGSAWAPSDASGLVTPS